MTPSISPAPKTWTLRFKHNRTTVLLHVDPLQNLKSVRKELLKAVQQTHPDRTLNGNAIPDSPEDVLLARPLDINDLSAGWVSLENKDDKGDLFEEKGKGKGKATAGRSKKSGDAAEDCPQVKGLRDGGVVAFKFRSKAENAAQTDEDEDEDLEKLDGEALVGEAEQEPWDVVVPTLEETYGDGDQAAPPAQMELN